MKSTNPLVRFCLLAILVFVQPPELHAQDVQVTAGSNRINIPPYVKDWEAAADLFFINLSCNFQQPTPIVLAIELTEDRLGRIAFGQSDVVFVNNAAGTFGVRSIKKGHTLNWHLAQILSQLKVGARIICFDTVPPAARKP